MMASQVILQFSTTRFQAYRRPPLEAGVLSWWHWRAASLPIFWRNKSSWMIRKMGHSPFSHVDFVLPPDHEHAGCLLGASDMGEGSPCIAGNPCGVAIRPPDYQEFGYRRQMILQTNKADEIYMVALTQLGKPFDNGGLRKFLSDDWPSVRDWRDTGKWWCSEGALWALETGGFWSPEESIAAADRDSYTLPWPKDRASPTDLLLVCVADSRFINAKTFWDPIKGLDLAPWEV